MTAEEKAQATQNKAVQASLNKAQQVDKEIIKMLLLGTGESGKSTIFKQLKLLYGKDHGFTQEEKAKYAETVHQNIIVNLAAVLEHTENVADTTGKGKIMALAEDSTSRIDGSMLEMLHGLWTDPGVVAAWGNRSQFQVQDALEYYMDNIDRIAQAGYTPNDQDILRSRIRTSGMVEEHYEIEGREFHIFDVGGQRNERRKWIHLFEGVTAIIFVTAINEYDQVLYEDNKTNRIEESLQVFEDIMNNPVFAETSMILFLNKRDLFREKLLRIPFRVEGERFDDFQGPYVELGKYTEGMQEFEECFEATKKYIESLFRLRNHSPSRKTIYTHVTTATDTKNVEFVFNSTRDILFRGMMKDIGM